MTIEQLNLARAELSSVRDSISGATGQDFHAALRRMSALMADIERFEAEFSTPMSNFFVPNAEISLRRTNGRVELKRATETGHGEVFIELDDTTIARIYKFMADRQVKDISEMNPYSADVRCGAWPTSVESGAER